MPYSVQPIHEADMTCLSTYRNNWGITLVWQGGWWGVLSNCDRKCTCLDLKIMWFWKNKTHVVRYKYEGIGENDCEPCQVCSSSHLPTWNRVSLKFTFQIFIRICQQIMIFVKSDKCNRHVTWKPLYIYGIIVLCWASVIKTDCILY